MKNLSNFTAVPVILKTNTVVVILGVMLLLAAGVYYFKFYSAQQHSSHWELVPTNVILVYERQECPECIARMQSSPIWKIIQSASLYQKGLDSVRATIFRLLPKAADLTISVHVTRKDEFDFVFYATGLPEKGKEFQNLAARTQRHSTRLFNEYEIHETGSTKEFLSWTMIGETWVGSFTSFLVEDVIRTASKGNGLANAAGVTKVDVVDGAGSLYVQLDRFSDMLSLFSASERSRYAFAKSVVLNIKAHDNDIVLNGFSADTLRQQDHLLSIFKRQSPVSFNLKNLIANNTIAVQSFGISDGATFEKDLSAFVARNAPRLRDSLTIAEKSAKVNFKDLYTSTGDELGLCYVESRVRNKKSKILLVETSDKSVWLKSFQKLAETFSIDTIFFERYSNYDIGEVPMYRFAEKLFAPLVTGFDQTFYTSLGNTIFLAENLDDLKRFLDHIDEDETWGKSVTHNKFLETTLLESNVSFFINTPRVWNLLSGDLQPRWKQFIKDHESLLRAVQLSAIQFSHVNNGFYTNVSINCKAVSENVSTETRSAFQTRFDQPITNLYAVKSHIDRRDEMLVQDSLNNLSLINSQGTVQWKVPIGEQITSEVTQIDYFRNGKLQYFFTTATGMHVIDRLGNYVEPFPVLLSGIELVHGVVVDYDHSKNYRFMVADKNGRIWMYDKEGQNLEGWQPKDIGDGLTVAPRHHRINGKDYIIAVRRDGKIFLMNRRGDIVKNFPTDVEGKPLGDYYLETEGPTDHFVLVTDDGYKVLLSPEGKILSREALIKSSVNSRFTLVAEKSLKSYLVAQQDNRGLIVMDQDGKKILTNESIGGNPAAIRLFDFGGGKSYIIITDLHQGYSYLYNGTGDLLSEIPIESTALSLRPKDSDENVLFTASGHVLTISPVKR